MANLQLRGPGMAGYAPSRVFRAYDGTIYLKQIAAFDRSASAYLHPRDAAALTRAKRLASRHRGRRIMALAAAIAVPAMAAPVDWQNLALGGQASAAGPITPMAFETPGHSFPGSAFYYLADEPYVPLGMDTGGQASPGIAQYAAPAPDPVAGPAARPLMLGGSAMDQSRALQCMTMAIYYEAASEADAGQRAVAQVVLNRVAHPSYPDTVCGVVFQGSQRTTGCQFSFTCDGSLARKPSKRFWDRARGVALAAIGGAVYRPAGLATHYHTVQIHPYWADSLDRIGTIGAHHFYRWKGAAGKPAAFLSRYLGGEPLPAPGRTAAPAHSSDALDPLALARAFEQSHPEAQISAAAQSAIPRKAGDGPPANPAPAYSNALRERGGEALFSGEKLPHAGSVKSEYAQSGQWIGQP